MHDGAMLSFAYGLTAFAVLLAVVSLVSVAVGKWKGAHKQKQKK